MLFEYFAVGNLIRIASIEETFDVLTIKVKPEESMRTFVPKLFDELKTLSNRDSFELHFEIAGTYKTIRDTHSSSLSVLNEHISTNIDETDYEIDLKVTKALNNSTVSIYFLEEFGKYLDQEPLKNIIATISKKFESKLKLEVFTTIERFGSNTIQFYQAQEQCLSSVYDNEINRKDKLELLFENSSIANRELRLLPSDFYLLSNSSYKSINNFFQKACTILSLQFISNASEFKNGDLFAYKISGYKTINCDGVSIDDLIKRYRLLYKIYSWAYEGGNSSDKIGLVRNVLSIHLDSDNNIKFDNEVWEAIQSNYQIYLKGNIQSYLEVKNKISEFIIESTTKTYALADELLDSLKNNIFILLTFLLTVVVVNGLKDNGDTNIFSDIYLGIVIILSLISGLWLGMVRYELVNRFDNATETIKEILKLNYNKLLMESEIDECVNPVIKKNKIYLTSQIKRYSLWWGVILIIFVFSYVCANLYFSEPSYTYTQEKLSKLQKKEQVPQNKLSKSKESIKNP